MRIRAAELRTIAEQTAALAGSHAESLGPAPDAADGPSATFRLGEVVWAREKGWPAWPAVVITRESARDLSPLSKLPLPLLMLFLISTTCCFFVLTGKEHVKLSLPI